MRTWRVGENCAPVSAQNSRIWPWWIPARLDLDGIHATRVKVDPAPEKGALPLLRFQNEPPSSTSVCTLAFLTVHPSSDPGAPKVHVATTSRSLTTTSDSVSIGSCSSSRAASSRCAGRPQSTSQPTSRSATASIARTEPLGEIEGSRMDGRSTGLESGVIASSLRFVRGYLRHRRTGIRFGSWQNLWQTDYGDRPRLLQRPQPRAVPTPGTAGTQRSG